MNLCYADAYRHTHTRQNSGAKIEKSNGIDNNEPIFPNSKVWNSIIMLLFDRAILLQTYNQDFNISFDTIEGFTIGILSTLFILFCGVMMVVICKRSAKNKKLKYIKVECIDSTDDEQACVNV